jgi:hypothetical protein
MKREKHILKLIDAMLEHDEAQEVLLKYHTEMFEHLNSRIEKLEKSNETK